MKKDALIRRLLITVIALAAVSFSGCATTQQNQEVGEADGSPGELEIVARLDTPPGNITVTDEGRMIVSLHQHFKPRMRVAEIVGGQELKPFPNASWNSPDGPAARRLDSVLGLQYDTEGILWLLDNGMRSGVTPKLVGWDVEADELYKIISLPEPVTRADSFLNDLAVDRDSNHIYIADPTRGNKPALIVVDILTGNARRVIESHVSVAPEPIDLVIGQEPALIRRPDGSTFRPRVGVNPIALDAANRWLYYGPMHGTAIYRVRTADLVNTEMTGEELAGGVERFGNKPISDGSSVNNAGEVYISDVGNNAVGKVNRNGSYVQLYQDDAILRWPDSFSFGPDGWCYVLINQLHLGPVLNAGKDETTPPYIIARFKTDVGGVIGR